MHISTTLSTVSSPPITLFQTHKGRYSDRLLSVRAEVRRTARAVFWCCVPSGHSFIPRVALWCVNIVVFILIAPLTKLRSPASQCGPRGLTGHYAERPDNPCTISGGLERHKHNVVRPTPLSPSSHRQHTTSSGPVGETSRLVSGCM